MKGCMNMKSTQICVCIFDLYEFAAMSVVYGQIAGSS